jgi:ABC-type multidrug transport system ATPase subunit
VGSDFQKSVWEILMKIPYGETWSYAKQSEILGDGKKVRAVANVNARDVSYLSTEFNFSDYQINGNEYIELIASFNSFSANILNAEIELIDNSISSSMLELSSGMRQILRIKALSLENKNIYLGAWNLAANHLAPGLSTHLLALGSGP